MSERDVEFIVRGSQIAKTVRGALLKTIANQDIVNIIHRKIMSDMLTVLEDDCEELNVYLENLPSEQTGWTGIEDDYPVSVKAVLNITAETGALEAQRRVRELPSVQKTGHWLTPREYCQYLYETTGERYSPAPTGLESFVYCSQCGATSWFSNKYCPHCGSLILLGGDTDD